MHVLRGALPSLITMDLNHSISHSPTAIDTDSSLHGTPVQGLGIETLGLNSPNLATVHQDTPRFDNSGAVRRRKGSKSLSDSVIKRSASTPNVRSSTTNDMPGSVLNDKKRNKLGYHRTSVACVHCRRRKIRCLAEPNDNLNRCVNCIRLKKECNFYPVDQQPPQERKTKASSRAGKKSHDNSSSSSSSPRFKNEASADYPESSTSFQDTPTNPHPYAVGMQANEAMSFSPPGSAAPYASTFDFAQQRHQWDESQHPYENPYIQEGHPPHYWGSSETPISPAYPYPIMPTTDSHIIHSNPSTFGAYPIPRAMEGVHPTRSMSYSQVESLAHENDPYHAQAPILTQEHQQRRPTNASEMLPPSLRHSASSSMVSINETIPSTYAGASAASMTHSMGGPYMWAPQTERQPPPSPKATEFGTMNTPWPYTEPAPLPKVQEEQEGHMQFTTDPAVLYSNAPHR